MPTTLARAALRPARRTLCRVPTRNASTTSEAANAASSTANKAKESASKATSKASEGLSKVSSSASSSMSKVQSAASGTAEKVSGRTSRLIGFVQSMIPPTVYYSKVGWEMSKMVFTHQKMSPPSSAQLQSYYHTMMHTIRNPSSLTSKNPGLLNPQQAMETIRNVNRQQMTTAGIVVAEILGFFTVGEMLGRLKIVGYRGKVDHHE